MVGRSQVVRRDAEVSILLGATSFFGGWLCYFSPFSVGSSLSTSITFSVLPFFPLFLCAIGFGFRGALVSSLTSLAPLFALAVSTNNGMGEQASIYRVLVLVMTTGLMRSIEPRIPSFLITLLTWVAVILPARYFFQPIRASSQTFWEHTLLTTCLSDVLMSLVAGAFMLNGVVRYILTDSPFRFQRIQVITHVVTLTAILSLFTVLATFNRIGMFSTNHFVGTNLWAAFGIIALFVVMPALIGFRLSLILDRDFPEERLGGSLIPSSHRVIDQENDTPNLLDAWMTSSSLPRVSNPGDETASNQNTHSPEGGVCIVDTKGAIVYANDTFRAQSSLAMPGIEGATLTNFVDTSELIREIAALLESLPHKQKIVTEVKIGSKKGLSSFFEVTICCDESKQESQISSLPFPEKPEDSSWLSGNSSRWIITVIDITSRRTVERELLHSQRLSSLTGFVSGAAHTFSDSFTSIVGRASCALMSSAPHTWRRALESISSEAERGGLLAGQLYEFSQQQSTFELQKGENRRIVPIDILDFIQQRALLLQNSLPNNCQIIVDKRTDDAVAKIEPLLMTQAVSNIVVNSYEAAKLNGSTPVVRISINREKIDQEVAFLHPGTRPGTYVRIRISDNGVGMNPITLARAVEPLYSTKKQELIKGSHTGMGLAVAFVIMREHDGFMTVESKPDKGSTVSLYLPASTEKAIKLRDTNDFIVPDLDAVPEECRNVIIVESRDDLRTLFVEMVEQLGHRATACRDQEEASLQLSKGQADIVITDEAFPLIGGTQLISNLREQYSQLRGVILATSVRESSCSLNHFISKPFDISRLGLALREAGFESGTTHNSGETEGATI